MYCIVVTGGPSRGNSVKTSCSLRQQTSPPVPPLGELDETYASSLILVQTMHKNLVRVGHVIFNARRYVSAV